MLSRLIFILLLLFAVPAFAGVHMPTGEYRESVTDLEVKVLGGLVAIERTWQADDLNRGAYRWHPNPAWDDLGFELDVIDGVPKTILRAGSRFERGGNDIYIPPSRLTPVLLRRFSHTPRAACARSRCST